MIRYRTLFFSLNGVDQKDVCEDVVKSILASCWNQFCDGVSKESVEDFVKITTYSYCYGDLRGIGFQVNRGTIDTIVVRYENMLKDHGLQRIENMINSLINRVSEYFKSSMFENNKYKLCMYCGSIFSIYETCRCMESIEDYVDTEPRGLCYMIRAGRKVKIGYVNSNNYSAIERRLSEYKTGIPEPENEIEIVHYEKYGRYREKELHDMFSKYRVRKNGEWFYFSDEIKQYIDDKRRINYVS